MIRRRYPPGVRIGVGDVTTKTRQDGSTYTSPEKQLWFRVGVAAVAEENTYQPIRYPTDWGLMQQLALAIKWPLEERAKALLEQGAEDEGKARARALAEFQPTEVPIRLLTNKPIEHGWFDAHLACWAINCQSRHMLVGFRPKTDAEIAEQPEAYEAQGIQVSAGSDRHHAEFWIGEATRYTDGQAAQIVCDPLTCPYYKSPDAKQRCTPALQLNFGVPWAKGYWWGSFKSRAWCSLEALANTLSGIEEQLRRQGIGLAGTPCLLKVEPALVHVREQGKNRKQPRVSLAPNFSMNELYRELEAFRGYRDEDVLALPTLNEQLALPDARRALESEFTPEAAAARGGAEEALRAQYAPLLTPAAVDSVFARTNSPDEAEAILEAMIRGQAEDVVDAEFEPELPLGGES